MRHGRLSWLLIGLTALCSMAAQASVTLSGTRVVFDGAEKEVTLRLNNDGKLPALVQAWIDKGDERASPDTLDVPFVVTPTIFRVEPHKSQTLRIIHSGEPLPSDKESLYWLNVLDVPPKATGGEDVNRLQFAFRTRVKLMYRPAGLPGDAKDAPSALKWTFGTDAEKRPVLKAENPSPYVVNIAGIELRANGKSFNASLGYVRPGETGSFPIKNAEAGEFSSGTILFSTVDDWGSNHAHEVKVGK
ncbi:molecular chaperone [Burkholderia cenocepacia]|uniref:fimbrial biogenesis chaperone n=1 Tax=Burkholderia cenocepacia TaxID=95486 RepID=UPI002AB6AC7E|nr:fimbria/pilus periplasmic chaperone [Burkholderia cenocepacia]